MADTASSPARLLVERLVKTYPSRSRELPVLTDVNLDLNAGDDVAIMGPSGSGKSTLLNILGGLDRPTAGSISVNGADPFTLAEPDLAKFRNQTVGFVFQDHHLLPQCSVMENILVPTLASGGVEPAVLERAKRLVDRVALSHRLDHRPGELSGGERQRVALCRALIMSPSLLLCDEPTGNLDHVAADRVAGLLIDLFRESGGILIVVTHSQALADRLSQRKFLADGRLRDISPRTIAPREASSP